MKSAKNIEAIYPLTIMQQMMLIHNLREHPDRGFVQVVCKLSGELKPDHFRKAWEKVFDMHTVLRSSIHWKDLEKPVQVIHRKVEIPFNFEDWSALNRAAAKKRLQEFLKSDQEVALDLSKAPISRITLIKNKDQQYELIWSCHHIVLDGWSSAVVIRDVFKVYDCLCNQKEPALTHLPGYQSFIKYYKNIDQASMKQYWKNFMVNYKKPALVSGNSVNKNKSTVVFRDLVTSLSEDRTAVLKTALRNSRITVNTLMVSVWGALLSNISRSNDVVFGSVVSGRSANLPGMDQMAGQFTNVLPVRITMEAEQSLDEWLVINQRQQAASAVFEYAALTQITTWCNWPGHLPLFDSLLIVENFPLEELTADKIKLNRFESGITTTYPINIIAIPGERTNLIIRYNPQVIHDHLAEWILEALNSMLNVFAQARAEKPVDLFRMLRPVKRSSLLPGKGYHPNAKRYMPPTNTSEIMLTSMWEEVLGLHPISVKDNFFELGGTSLLAVRLFDQISTKTGRNLPPSLLLQHPTIESLAKAWSSENGVTKWSSLVPLRASGSKPPIFAIHGGGGHVFFYQPLAKYLDQDQPVFALQPVGLDGETEKHQSIEQMAAHYLGVIRSIRPKGPVSLLGTCLSDPICVEINNQMREKGEAPLAIFIVDSSPFHLFPRKKNKTPRNIRIQRFRERFKRTPYQAIRKIFADRLKKLTQVITLKWDDFRVEYGNNRQARILLNMREQLQKLYYQYHWNPFEGKITLLKTSQNFERPNNWDEGVWAKLASDKVDVLVFPGEHYTRFEEPEVIEMAKQLQTYLNRIYQSQGLIPEKESSLN